MNNPENKARGNKLVQFVGKLNPAWTPILLCLVFSAVSVSAASMDDLQKDWKVLFPSFSLSTNYSPALQEKNSRPDSLLPPVDGDEQLRELLRARPDLWSFSRIESGGEILTGLEVRLTYIDGTREDQTCQVISADASNWKLDIGVDFTGGASTVVGEHIALCLQEVRDTYGYTVKKDDKIIRIPPRDVLKELDEQRVNANMDHNLQTRVLQVHNEVVRSGKCPEDIEAYLLLLEIYEEVKATPIDIIQLSRELNPEQNGSKEVFSCAFSRRWNQKYSEEVSLTCDVDNAFCKYDQSDDGLTRWKYVKEDNRFYFEPLKILFLSFGGKSIHSGGRMLDLQLIPLSRNLYLEAYTNEKQEPVSLGLVTIGKQVE